MHILSHQKRKEKKVMVENFPELVKDTDTGNTTYTTKKQKQKKNPQENHTFRYTVLKQ